MIYYLRWCVKLYLGVGLLLAKILCLDGYTELWLWCEKRGMVDLTHWSKVGTTAPHPWPSLFSRVWHDYIFQFSTILLYIITLVKFLWYFHCHPNKTLVRYTIFRYENIDRKAKKYSYSRPQINGLIVFYRTQCLTIFFFSIPNPNLNFVLTLII